MSSNFCKKCVYPHHAVNLDISDENICSACYVAEEIENISFIEWENKKQILVDLIKKNKASNKYDCIIPVGGGKDSYFQTHTIKELGFNPLLVTYYGNNYLPEGQINLDKMRENFDCDHVIFYPNIPLLKKINKAAFKMMGDMNWHNHTGIRLIPLQTAIKESISLFIYGEISWDIAGMFSPNDFAEYNKRTVLEHDMRGFTRKDFIGKEGISSNELLWCEFPSDDLIKENNTKGLYLGNFLKWNSINQTEIIKEKYNWIEYQGEFERTYRKISNLDDMHENGIHDYMKWIKFGYGRCTDHASKDIRLGLFNREVGVQYVKKYDHVKPTKDLKRWLDYVEMSEEEFDHIADTFREPKVWMIDNKKWYKEDIDGEIRCYGETSLNIDSQEKYKKK